MGIQGSVMKGNILRAGLVLITIVTVCIITDFSTIMVLIGATCCSLLGKCLIISPGIHALLGSRTAWCEIFRFRSWCGAWVPDRTSFVQHIQAFILPAITHLRIFRNRLTKQNKIEDYTILVFGIIGTIIGSIDAAKRLGIIPIPEGEEVSELP